MYIGDYHKMLHSSCKTLCASRVLITAWKTVEYEHKPSSLPFLRKRTKEMFYRTWLHKNHRGAALGSLVFIPDLGMVEISSVISQYLGYKLKQWWNQSLHSSGATCELARAGTPCLLNYLLIWESHCNLRELKRRFLGSWETVQLRAKLCTPGSTPRDTASMRKR